jgi:acyl-CoA thioesterase
MTSAFTTLINSIQSSATGEYSVDIPPEWAQGTSTYGGLTAALGLEAVLRSHGDLPPLRSAQINFVGSAGGSVRIETSMIRQGRSMTVVQGDVMAEKGLATRSTFAFGHPRESQFSEVHVPTPEVALPGDCAPYFKGPLRPVFTQHFESRLAQGGMPLSGSEHSNHFIWVRYKDPVPFSIVSLLALADMPPPAMMPKFTTFKPVSSLTWMVNMLQEAPQPFEDGWWLLQSRAEHASQGYSSQDMLVWGADFQPVIAGRQLVAIYL